MNEIKQLLEQWQLDALGNPEGLQTACDAIVLLSTKVEELEARLEQLENL